MRCRFVLLVCISVVPHRAELMTQQAHNIPAGSDFENQHRVHQKYTCASLIIFFNEGGIATPLRTEKASPCAWPGP